MFSPLLIEVTAFALLLLKTKSDLSKRTVPPCNTIASEIVGQVFAGFDSLGVPGACGRRMALASCWCTIAIF